MGLDTIATLDFRAYQEVVRQQLHPEGRDEQIWTLLLTPPLLDRTADSLRDMLHRCESTQEYRKQQLSQAGLRSMTRDGGGRAAYQAAEAEYEAWRVRNRNFRRLVEHRLADVKNAQREQFESSRRQRADNRAARLSSQAHAHRQAVRAMAVQIQRHQAMTARSGRDPEQHDYDLWRLLDELSVPVEDGGDPVPLRSVLRVYWQDTTPATVEDGERAQTERLMKAAPGGRSPQFEGKPRAQHIAPTKRLT